MDVFYQHFNTVIVVACLILGYIIKHATLLKFIPNNDIPVILAIAGALLNVLVGTLSVETVIYGAFMGLASTGLHQAFSRYVENFATSASTKEPGPNKQ